MWKTFQAEFVALWKSRLRFASWIILLFMPLIYGFLFLSSFWSPFKNTDRLPIVVVNLDIKNGTTSAESNDLVKVLKNDGKDLVFNGGSSKYKINVKSAEDIYKTKDEVERDVNSGKYSAAFVIPEGYGSAIADIRGKMLADFTNNKNPDFKGLIEEMQKTINANIKDNALIDFYNSFKMSYVAGEMTNMGSSLYRLIGDLIFPDAVIAKDIITNINNELSGAITTKVVPVINKGIGTVQAAVNKFTPQTAQFLSAVVLQKLHDAENIINPILGLSSFATLKALFTSAQADLMYLAKTDPAIPANVAPITQKVTDIKNSLQNIIDAVNKLTTSQLLPIIDKIRTQVQTEAGLGNILVNHRTYGKREGVVGEHDILNTYGYGLSPYFLSIVLWAGALLMVFLFPNKRYIKTENTIKNMAGKTAVWVLTGWIQTLLLFAIISIPGIFGTMSYDLNGTTVVIKQCINLGADQGYLILFGLFASTMFMLIVRGIVYTIRVADIGLFICVILLILQLVSSGGTFPASMQPGFFKFLHKILPFTYTVSAIREIYWDTDSLVVLKDVGILLIIPAIFTATSIISGYFWDKKTHYKRNGKTFYRSMDKNVGSL